MPDWVAATGVGVRDKSIFLSIRAHDLLCSLVKLQYFIMQSRVSVPCENIAVEPVSQCTGCLLLLKVNSQPSVDVLQPKGCFCLPRSIAWGLGMPLNGEYRTLSSW